MKRNMYLLAAISLTILTPSGLHAADPVIHVQWDGGGTPLLDTDYTVDTTETGTPAFPDVILNTGRTDWRVWSTDADNSADGYVGDIGMLSSPADANFAVKLLDDSGGFGARDVKAIRLVPTSTSYYGSLIGDPNGVAYSRILGQLTDELTVQADTSGNGGEVAVNIGGDTTADMTIHKALTLRIPAEASGMINIGELTGTASIGVVSGSIDIGSTSGENPILRFFYMYGALTVSEVGGDSFALFFPDGMSETSTATFGDITATEAIMNLGDQPGGGQSAGTMDFLAGIPSNTQLVVANEFTETAIIDLNEQEIAGSLYVSGGGGSVVNGGAVSGTVTLGGFDDFAGSATFGDVTGSIASVSALSGTIEILGEVGQTGSITVGDIAAGGRLEFGPQWTSFPDVGGTVSLLSGVGAGAEVNIRGPLTATGQVDLNGAGVAGTLILNSGGAGEVVNGGIVEGTVILGVCCNVIPEAPGGPFTGTSTFTETSGDAAIYAHFGSGGTLHLTGSHGAGIIAVTDEMDAEAAIIIDGDALGDIAMPYVWFFEPDPH